MCFDEFDHKMINDLILLDLFLHLFLFHRLACRMKKYMPISEAWESIYLPMPFLGSLSFDGLLVVSLLALLNIRVGSKKLCGNSSILLALIFSVKSILANLESLKWPFWPLLSPWFFTYETFLLVSWAEILSYVTFVPLKLPTWPFLKLSICFKIDITENLSSIEIHEFSHCVKFTLVSPNRFHVKIGMRFKMSFWFYEKVLDNGPIQNF